MTRRFLLRQAFLLAHEDGEFASSERGLIDFWANRWGVPATELTELEEEVTKQMTSRPALNVSH